MPSSFALPVATTTSPFLIVISAFGAALPDTTTFSGLLSAAALVSTAFTVMSVGVADFASLPAFTGVVAFSLPAIKPSLDVAFTGSPSLTLSSPKIACGLSDFSTLWISASSSDFHPPFG